MANNIPFQAMGKTVKIVAGATANTQSNVFTITADSPCQQYFLANSDTNAAVYIKISSLSNLTVQLPDTGPDYVISLPPYSYKVITGVQVSPTANVYARVIGDSANASVYLTPGEGF